METGVLQAKAEEIQRACVVWISKVDATSGITTLIKSIATLKKTWMPLYEQYTDGKLSREDFLMEKEEI